MRHCRPPRAGLAALAMASAFALAALAGAVAPELTRDTRAQDQSSGVSPPGAIDPAEAVMTGASPLVSATPAIADIAAAATSVADVADAGGSATTSLGGSDIAVSSVGGSYEVDAPKRRAKHAPKPMPTP